MRDSDKDRTIQMLLGEVRRLEAERDALAERLTAETTRRHRSDDALDRVVRELARLRLAAMAAQRR